MSTQEEKKKEERSKMVTSIPGTLILHERIHDNNAVKALFKETLPVWARKAKEAIDLRDQGLLSQAEEVATQVMQESEKVQHQLQQEFLKNEPVEGRLFCSLMEEMALEVRAFIRMQAGNFTGAIDDLTLQLFISSLTQNDPPSIDDHKYTFKLLHARAECFTKLISQEDSTNLSYYDGLIEDIKATSSLIGSVGEANLNISNEMEENQSEVFLRYTAERKMIQLSAQGNALTRPVFSAWELSDMEKALGRPLFEKESSYVCRHCEKSGIGLDGRLFLCSACKRAWFCNKDCQRQGWPKHKKDCQRGFLAPIVFEDDIKDSCQEDSRNGIIAYQFGETMHFLARDPSTGRLFDTITDKDVYFVPSELAQLKSLGDEVGIEFQFF